MDGVHGRGHVLRSEPGTPAPDVADLMGAEARELRPGGEAVITRLADILVVHAIRAWIEADPAVATLADEVAMSRAAFAARLTELVGESAMQYVTRWRMHLAVDALRHDRADVAQLADRLGYRSEAALARAFERVVGVPPGAVKQAPRHVTLAPAA